MAIIFACFMLALAAQDAIKVNYKGAKPTISDFACAFFSTFEDEEDQQCPQHNFRSIMLLY